MTINNRQDMDPFYFYMSKCKATYLNISSINQIAGGSAISGMMLGKNTLDDVLTITANQVGSKGLPVIIKGVQIVQSKKNAIYVNGNTAHIVLMDSFIQNTLSKSISASANNLLIFSIRNSQFFSTGPLEFISRNTSNITSLSVRIDSSSFEYITQSDSVIALKAVASEFKTCSSYYSNNLNTNKVISVEDDTYNSESSLKGFVSNSVFSNNAGDYISFYKGKIDPKYLICGNVFTGGVPSNRAMMIKTQNYTSNQNNNLFNEAFSKSVIEISSENVQVSFGYVIFNCSASNLVSLSQTASSVNFSLDNSFVSPKTNVPSNCFNLNSSSYINFELHNSTLKNCGYLNFNSPSTQLNLFGNSSIYTSDYFQTNFRCSSPASIQISQLNTPNDTLCFDKLVHNNCLLGNISLKSCSDSIFSARFTPSFIKPCQKKDCGCFWRGDCSCKTEVVPSISVQTVIYCSEGNLRVKKKKKSFFKSFDFFKF